MRDKPTVGLDSQTSAAPVSNETQAMDPAEAIRQLLIAHSDEIDTRADDLLTWREVSNWSAEHVDLVKKAGLESNLLARDEAGNLKPRGFSWQKLAENSGGELRQSKQSGSYFTFNTHSTLPSSGAAPADGVTQPQPPSGNTAPILDATAPPNTGNEAASAPRIPDSADQIDSGNSSSPNIKTTDAKDKVWVGLNVIDIADGKDDDNRATMDSLLWAVAPENHTLDNFPDLKRAIQFFVDNQSDTALLEEFGFDIAADGTISISTDSLVMAAIDTAGDGEGGKPDGLLSPYNLVAASKAGLLNGDNRFAERLRELNSLVESVLSISGPDSESDRNRIFKNLGFSSGQWLISTGQLQQGIEDGTLVGDEPL